MTTIDAVVITARLSAISGEMAWRMPVPATPSLLDIAMQGYAVVCYDGNRAPRMAPCVGCKRKISHAWRVHPIGFTVPACTGDCAADRIETIWSETRPEDLNLYYRVRGERARRMAFGEVAE